MPIDRRAFGYFTSKLTPATSQRTAPPPLAFRQRALPHSGSLLTFLTASDKYCALSYGSLCVFSHVPQQIASSSLNFVEVQITEYQMVFYTVHSSQCMAHSSWLTAHGSQLTPRPQLFRFSVTDSPQPPNFPNIQAKKLIVVLIPTSHEEFSFCSGPWTNLSKPPSTKRPRVTSRQNMKRTRHIPMPCFQRLNFQIRFRISVHAQVVLAGYPLLQWPLFVLATLCSSLLL
jgi:hypothetical protein